MVYQHAAASGSIARIVSVFRGMSGFALLIISAANAVAFDNDPIGILRGVENSRQALHSGKLVFECHFRNARGDAVRDIAVVFDGVRRRYVVEKVTGKKKPELTRVMFDGTQVVRFDGVHTAWLRELSDTSSDLMFDPRLLGITHRYSARETIEAALGDRTAKTVSLVGEEQTDGVATWHVRARTVDGEVLDFWVERSTDFRIRRCESKLGEMRIVTTSTYDDRGGSLPCEVRTIRSRGSRLLDERHIVVKRSELGVPVDESTWTLNGLDLPVGTAINDDRLMRRVGYWDGTNIVEQVSRRSDVPGEVLAAEAPSKRPNAFLMINGVTVALIAIVLVIRYRRRA